MNEQKRKEMYKYIYDQFQEDERVFWELNNAHPLFQEATNVKNRKAEDVALNDMLMQYDFLTKILDSFDPNGDGKFELTKALKKQLRKENIKTIKKHLKNEVKFEEIAKRIEDRKRKRKQEKFQVYFPEKDYNDRIKEVYLPEKEFKDIIKEAYFPERDFNKKSKKDELSRKTKKDELTSYQESQKEAENGRKMRERIESQKVDALQNVKKINKEKKQDYFKI
ncbi:MAG: hypothetical protein IJ837_02430 [Clostridia bacterium]|nr:hypothetical protein [Clostridia bacterium]